MRKRDALRLKPGAIVYEESRDKVTYRSASILATGWRLGFVIVPSASMNPMIWRELLRMMGTGHDLTDGKGK